MKVKITFKHLPRSGKFQRSEKGKTKYYVHDGGFKKHQDIRLPKFLWDKL